MTDPMREAHFTDAQLDQMYEDSKRDVQFVGSEIRQLIGDIRTVRAALTASAPGEQQPVAFVSRLDLAKVRAGGCVNTILTRDPQRPAEGIVPVYTSAPPAAEWDEALSNCHDFFADIVGGAKITERSIQHAWKLLESLEALRRESPACSGIFSSLTPEQQEQALNCRDDGMSRPDAGGDVREALGRFETFLNEPPEYEAQRTVREYRHEAYREWSAVRNAVTSALSTGPAAVERHPYCNYIDGRPLYIGAPGETNASAEAQLRKAILDILNSAAPAAENLACNQEQADMDGCMVKVSRQALDEVLAAVNEVAIQAATPGWTAVGDEAKKSEGGTLVAPYNPCLAKLRKDEPFFVLLGRDKQAPTAVIAWADARERSEGKSDWTEQAREVATTMAAYSDAPSPSDQTADRREIVARIKADPGDGTVHPDLAHVLARGFDAMGWGRPQHAAEDMIDAILATLDGGR